MTEEKKEIIEKLRARKMIAELAAFTLIIVGAVIAMFATVHIAVWSEVMDDDHITDQNLTIREEANATYTWTHQEIRFERFASFGFLALGMMMIMPGYALVFYGPKDSEMHKLSCTGLTVTSKYCPECGLKMSRLEKE